MFETDAIKEHPRSDHPSMIKLYFSLNGRISRSTLWMNFGLPVLPTLFSLVMLLMPVLSDDQYSFEEKEIIINFVIGGIAVYPFSVVPCVKRLHDLDYSGWYYFLQFIPIVNIYYSFLMFFYKGTTGTNRYGRDPLELSTSIVKYNWGMLLKLSLVFIFIFGLFLLLVGIAKINDQESTESKLLLFFSILICLPSGYFLFRRKKEQSNSGIQNITVEDQNGIKNSQINNESIESKLVKLKSMLDQELITEEDFNTKKQKLIDEM